MNKLKFSAQLKFSVPPPIPGYDCVVSDVFRIGHFASARIIAHSMRIKDPPDFDFRDKFQVYLVGIRHSDAKTEFVEIYPEQKCSDELINSTKEAISDKR